MYKLILHKSAEKKIDRLPQNWKVRIIRALELISQNPYIGKVLHGDLEGCSRVRVGDFRIIYGISEKDKTVFVHAIGSRGDIYK